MSSLRKLDLTFDTHVLHAGEAVEVPADSFDILDTDISGLKEFFRNIDTVHLLYGDKDYLEELRNYDVHTEHMTFYDDLNTDIRIDIDTIDGCICVCDSGHVSIAVKKSLNLPYDDLITNFTMLCNHQMVTWTVSSEQIFNKNLPY